MSGQETVALIAGGAGGIGRGVVHALAAQRIPVAVLDLQSNTDATLSVRGDLTVPAEVDGAIATVRERLGEPTWLVCAAGIVREGPYEELLPEQWRSVLDVSLTSAYLLTRAVLPGMVARGGGAIVTLSSGWARKGYPLGAEYAAAKGGVESLTKSIALEFAARGIRANSIAPGPVRTAMTQDNPAFDEAARTAAIPLGRIGEVEDIVDPILFLLGDQARYITGQVLHVNGGLLMP